MCLCFYIISYMNVCLTVCVTLRFSVCVCDSDDVDNWAPACGQDRNNSALGDCNASISHPRWQNTLMCIFMWGAAMYQKQITFFGGGGPSVEPKILGQADDPSAVVGVVICTSSLTICQYNYFFQTLLEELCGGCWRLRGVNWSPLHSVGKPCIKPRT